MNLARVVGASIALLVLSSACAQGPMLRGRVQGLQGIAETAEKNGAIRCAPRELALAKSHLRFATTELDQGEMSNAEARTSFGFAKKRR